MDKQQFELLQELAKSGDEQAMSELMEFISMQSSYHIPSDLVDMVVDNVERLIEKGDAHAMLEMGTFYYGGLLGFDQDFTKARYWYEKAADLGDDWALCNLGYCYFYGRDVEIDYEKAYYYFLKSSHLNNPNALYKLGDMYFYGNQVEQDYDIAFYWYERAKYYAIEIMEGDHFITSEVYPNICHRLGICYMNGYGTELDLLEALTFFHVSERGFYQWIKYENPFAQLSLKKTQKQLQLVRRKLNDSILKSEKSGGVVVPLFSEDDE